MSQNEERRMIIEMLSEGKINVEDAESLLEALESSGTRARSKNNEFCFDFESFIPEDFMDDLRGGLEKGLGKLGEFDIHFGKLNDFFEDFKDWDEDEVEIS